MRSRRVAVALALAGASAAAACAIDIPDVVTNDAGDATASDALGPDVANDVGSSDAAADVVIDVPIPSCDAGACGAPAGFTPVFLATGDNNAKCPASMTQTDLAADPQPGNGACTCDCSVTTQPKCVPQTLTTLGNNSPNCSARGSTLVDGGCNSAMIGLQTYIGVDPMPTVTPGACSGNPVANTSAVTTTKARLCTDTTCSACTAPTGYTLCYEASGAATCPGGMTAHTVGGGVTLGCAACSACSVTGTCGGTVDYYSDQLCLTQIGNAVPVNGTCATFGATGGTARSLRYSPVVTGLACTPGTTSVSSVSLGSELTVCCP